MWSESTTSKRRTGLALLFVAVLIVSSVGPVLAAPRVFVASASMDRSTAVTGDPVDVSFQLQNGGDSGAGRVEITVNGTVAYSDRYQVESDEERDVTEQITFEDPGRYVVRVNDKRAGVINVSRTLVDTTDDRSDGRSMVLRGGRIPYNSQLTTQFPTTNESVAIESLTYRTLRNEFNRNIELYTNASSAPVRIPTGDRTTVFGAMTIQTLTGIEDQRIRIGVNQTTVDESPISSNDVHIYRASDDRYVELDTTEVQSEDGRYVFETRTNDTGTLLVGSLAPSFEVSGQSLSTSEIDGEKRIVVSANVTNTGSVAGDYTVQLELDGEVVNNQTVTLEPGETRETVVGDRISRDGSYRVALNGQFLGTVVVDTGAGGQTATETEPAEETQTDADTQAGGTETDDAGATATDDANGETDASGEDGGESEATEETQPSDDGSEGPGFSLPSANVGLTEIAIGGGVAVIGVILVLLQRW